MILIVGDSFSANNNGWPSLLNQPFVNLSQNGIGEYKIYKNFKNYKDNYKLIIFCHTSPWRIHTKFHPIHSKNNFRPNNDFILSDVDYHSKENKDMQLVKNYIDKFYDFDYQQDVYNLLVKELVNVKNSLHITFHDPLDTKQIPINFNAIWQNNQGNINHMNATGNTIVADKLIEIIKSHDK